MYIYVSYKSIYIYIHVYIHIYIYIYTYVIYISSIYNVYVHTPILPHIRIIYMKYTHTYTNITWLLIQTQSAENPQGNPAGSAARAQEIHAGELRKPFRKEPSKKQFNFEEEEPEEASTFEFEPFRMQQVCCGVLRCVAVCCGVLRCVAVCCSAVPYCAACCSFLRCLAVQF